MKRLSKFEVDCLVDVVESKLMRIEKEKLKIYFISDNFGN